MSYLLDTCVLSEYVKKHPFPVVIDWLDSADEKDLFISILSIGELKKGIIKIEQSQPKKFQRLSLWIEKLELRFDGRIIPVEYQVINQWSRLCGESLAKGRKLPVLDSLIAATGIAYDLVIVTRNVDDFSFASVDLFNPWELEK